MKLHHEFGDANTLPGPIYGCPILMARSSGLWVLWGYNAFGLSLLPLLVGIGWLFFDGRSIGGWYLTACGTLIILAGIIANLHIYFAPTSLFDTLVILGLVAGGIGVVARSLRAQQSASLLPAQHKKTERPRLAPLESLHASQTISPLWGHSSAGGQSCDEGDQEQGQEDIEEDLGDACGRGGDPAEAE